MLNELYNFGFWRYGGFSEPTMGSRVLKGILSTPFVASPAGLPGGYAPGALLGVTGSNPAFGDFRNVSEKGFSRAASGGERQRARQLLGSCSGVPRECLGRDLGVTGATGSDSIFLRNGLSPVL